MEQSPQTTTTFGITRPVRECLTVSLRADNRQRVIAAAERIGLPVSRLVDMILDGNARLDGDRAEIISR